MKASANPTVPVFSVTDEYWSQFVNSSMGLSLLMFVAAFVVLLCGMLTLVWRTRPSRITIVDPVWVREYKPVRSSSQKR